MLKRRRKKFRNHLENSGLRIERELIIRRDLVNDCLQLLNDRGANYILAYTTIT